MKAKTLWVCVLVLTLVACVGNDIKIEQPTLDGTRLNETAVSLVTLDFAETQAHLPTKTTAPKLTSTPIPTIDRTRPLIQTPTSELACNVAAAGQPIDITIPDDTRMAPNTAFSKTWRLKNIGACTWTRLYSVTFFSGNSLSAQYAHYFMQPVEPGETVDLTVDMIAPEKIGLYQSNWMLSDPDGALFGIGPHADAPFWVRIEVVQMVTDTPKPTPTQTKTPTVYISGAVDLMDGDVLDLDTASLNPEEDEEPDLQYEYGGTIPYKLMPLNGMKWVAFGEEEPGFAECFAAIISADRIEFAEVPLGRYYCYQTSRGLWGWLKIEGFTAEKLLISFITWASP